MDVKLIIEKLRKHANPDARQGMKRFGINPENLLGVNVAGIRKIAKGIKKDHGLALRLWDTGIHEAKILASIIDEHEKVTEQQMEGWALGFDSWDVCDQTCSNLFRKTDLAYNKAIDWSSREEEFVKRAGFVLMAVLAVHDKKEKDQRFIEFFKYIKKESTDNRNFVKKAVNWALRQIGKRNRNLNREAIKVAEELKSYSHKSAKWIANNALRELKSKTFPN